MVREPTFDHSAPGEAGRAVDYLGTELAEPVNWYHIVPPPVASPEMRSATVFQAGVIRASPARRLSRCASAIVSALRTVILLGMQPQ